MNIEVASDRGVPSNDLLYFGDKQHVSEIDCIVDDGDVLLLGVVFLIKLHQDVDHTVGADVVSHQELVSLILQLLVQDMDFVFKGARMRQLLVVKG